MRKCLSAILLLLLLAGCSQPPDHADSTAALEASSDFSQSVELAAASQSAETAPSREAENKLAALIVRNNTDAVMLEELYCLHAIQGEQALLADTLAPGEEVEYAGVAKWRHLVFTATLTDEPRTYYIPCRLRSGDTAQAILSNEEKLTLQINGADEAGGEYEDTYIYDEHYQGWVNISHGKLFCVDVPDERLMQIDPERQPSPTYGGATVLFCYEDIYNLKVLVVKNPPVAYEGNHQDSLEITKVYTVADTFTYGDILMCNPDHWSYIRFFLQYYDADGVEYRYFLSEPGFGWGAVYGEPTHSAEFLSNDIELIFTDDTEYEAFEGKYLAPTNLK